MKKCNALGLAFLLFSFTVLVIHLGIKRLDFTGPSFDAWVNDDKLLYSRAITENLTSTSIPVFGSSEFRHGRSTPYHPAKVLSGQPFRLMLIGAGYYQSLSHATALAAMGDELPQKQAVFILSPQWVRGKGVSSQVYTSRFSEYNYIQMLQNPHLSDETKNYILERTDKLLKADPAMAKRVKSYQRVYLTKDATFLEKLSCKIYLSFLEDKLMVSLSLKALAGGVSSQEYPQGAPEPNWKALSEKAAVDGAKANTTNPFGMDNGFYNLYKNNYIKSKKDSATKADYLNSQEYGDMICFLKVCQDLQIKPLLVSLPFNGPWYDYMGLSAEKRQEYYEKIQAIAQDYGAELLDLSSYEYTPYFFEDNTHIAREGWVKLNEGLYQFASQGLSE